MWKRLRVSIARLLMRGTECVVVRRNVVSSLQADASELQEYVAKSGALNDSKWIHAWRRVHALTTKIREKAIESEATA